MKRKGISPLIAAVLLIAFTMAVASLFAQWAPQLIQDAQGDTSNTTQEVQDCSSVTMELIDSNASVTTVRQTGGDRNVGNVSVTFFYDNADPIVNYVTLNGVGSAERVWTGSSNSLSEIVAQPTNCEGGAQATYKVP